jgi:hypothetical protein
MTVKRGNFKRMERAEGPLPMMIYEGEILHGGIEHLFHALCQPVDLIDEQHIAATQIGKDGSQVPGALDGRSGRYFDVDLHLVGEHMRRGGLAQSGRSVKEHMVKRVTTLLGSLDQNYADFR